MSIMDYPYITDVPTLRVNLTCLGKPKLISIFLITNKGKQKTLLNMLIAGVVSKIKHIRGKLTLTKPIHDFQKVRNGQYRVETYGLVLIKVFSQEIEQKAGMFMPTP